MDEQAAIPGRLDRPRYLAQTVDGATVVSLVGQNDAAVGQELQGQCLSHAIGDQPATQREGDRAAGAP